MPTKPLTSYLAILFTIYCSLFSVAHAMEAKVVVAKGLIKRGQVIKAEDLGVEQREFYKMPVNISQDSDAIIDKAAKVDIRPGTVIKANMLDSKILVKRGDNVSIVAEAGALRITAAGQAVEDGREGKFIKVLNLSSKKMVAGRVNADATVSVQF